MDISLFVSDDGDRAYGEQIAEELQISLVQEMPASESVFLFLNGDGLSLCGGGQSMRGDFTKMLPRLKPNNLNGEMLIKAAKCKDCGEHPLAVDATAGMGEDSLLLAAYGFEVILFEYDPVIYVLLRDTLRRGAQEESLRGIMARMHLQKGNSIEAMAQMTQPPCVILLDPMFPERQKSALVKKKFQLLHFLERPCEEEAELLNAAIGACPRKIVIKRPAKGAFLAGQKPSYSHTGKAVRYDIIIDCAHRIKQMNNQ